MSDEAVGEVVEGLWRFVALHPESNNPEWTAAAERGEDGWDPLVSWWVVGVAEGLVLIDPLVEDWQALDLLLSDRGDCLGIVRTCHWHHRSVAEAASRYGVEVWSKIHPDGRAPHAVDHEVRDQDELFGSLRAIDVERADEIALWLGEQGALLFGDAMLRRSSGELRVCPDSWLQPAGGPARLRALLRGLTELAPRHVLVSHGPLVLGDGLRSLEAATS
jgi:glyoxylase-like metal-dependent hydrolase (beta-lactamase superfamily II)